MSLQTQTKRILTDIAGYLLIIASGLTGWLPGPGGIPLLIAGLGLLSINNKWAHDLREYVLNNGGKVIQKLFPAHAVAQWTYDVVVVAFYGVAAYLAWNHAVWWQVSLAASLFFGATFIALMNRQRLESFKERRRKKP
ncbi:hypothetical protein IPL85_00480 [Candidatus Saccharibacteria bacterium]|nr:MAG: hypothetical protein IPL85_00480 [Candidatus Saccharibacteria bacterium]